MLHFLPRELVGTVGDLDSIRTAVNQMPRNRQIILQHFLCFAQSKRFFPG